MLAFLFMLQIVKKSDPVVCFLSKINSRGLLLLEMQVKQLDLHRRARIMKLTF